MSKASSLREHLARPAPARGIARARSGSPTSLLLEASDAIERPVDVARLLVRHGMPLRAAHRVVTRIAGGEQVPLVLAKVADPRKLVAALAALGVAATPRRVPASVDVKKIRDKLGLSQAEFAARFCFDIRTLQNWEQGRSTPDRYARTLLRTIARDPAAVEATLAETG